MVVENKNLQNPWVWVFIVPILIGGPGFYTIWSIGHSAFTDRTGEFSGVSSLFVWVIVAFIVYYFVRKIILVLTEREEKVWDQDSSGTLLRKFINLSIYLIIYNFWNRIISDYQIAGAFYDFLSKYSSYEDLFMVALAITLYAVAFFYVFRVANLTIDIFRYWILAINSAFPVSAQVAGSQIAEAATQEGSPPDKTALALQKLEDKQRAIRQFQWLPIVGLILIAGLSYVTLESLLRGSVYSEMRRLIFDTRQIDLKRLDQLEMNIRDLYLETDPEQFSNLINEVRERLQGFVANADKNSMLRNPDFLAPLQRDLDRIRTNVIAAYELTDSDSDSERLQRSIDSLNESVNNLATAADSVPRVDWESLFTRFTVLVIFLFIGRFLINMFFSFRRDDSRIALQIESIQLLGALSSSKDRQEFHKLTGRAFEDTSETKEGATADELFAAVDQIAKLPNDRLKSLVQRIRDMLA